ncbi:hypothetical protein B0H15DRAFT_86225 [Mycena belliarum]|uniref:Uncharacterized protein n=1 Tax=Mycena belliarum TaxID=1033014 RepID=A0AAD6TMQ4_9AGAR|nr:hypothetical protein B0H15DRAFT_86225 [Mycena belliae]
MHLHHSIPLWIQSVTVCASNATQWACAAYAHLRRRLPLLTQSGTSPGSADLGCLLQSELARKFLIHPRRAASKEYSRGNARRTECWTRSRAPRKIPRRRSAAAPPIRLSGSAAAMPFHRGTASSAWYSSTALGLNFGELNSGARTPRASGIAGIRGRTAAGRLGPSLAFSRHVDSSG